MNKQLSMDISLILILEKEEGSLLDWAVMVNYIREMDLDGQWEMEKS